MKKVKINKKDIILIILIILAIILGIVLISNIARTRNSLDKIIYDAKVEAEKALIETGEMIYTKDVEGNNGIQIISDESLPENTVENQQSIGTVVAPKENWNIETVTAVSVGNGDTVPVPIGFYYVGGDLSTGVIISDEKEDEYDGETDKTTWEYTTKLKGNQFVWIPCKEEEYKKCDVWNGIAQKPEKTEILAAGSWDKTTYTSELPQIRKYGGFYVARYEAGLAKTITEFTSTQQDIGSNQVYNIEGIPQSRANQVPWMFIEKTTSQKNAKNMYNTVSVSSGLITGTQWDVMLKKIVEKTDLTEADLTDSENWGNHKNNSIEYKGRLANFNGANVSAFGGETEGKTSLNNGELLTTGASKQTEKYHIFDVAGNLWECTDEASLYKEGNENETNIQYTSFRGGGATDSSEIFPVCFRDCRDWLVSNTGNMIGFRVVLYIK